MPACLIAPILIFAALVAWAVDVVCLALFGRWDDEP
jgi:hypothetical protein